MYLGTSVIGMTEGGWQSQSRYLPSNFVSSGSGLKAFNQAAQMSNQNPPPPGWPDNVVYQETWSTK